MRRFIIFHVSIIIFLTCGIFNKIYGKDNIPINIIPNGDFQGRIINNMPVGWILKSPKESLSPTFSITKENNRQGLFISGNGKDNCIGKVSSEIQIELGKTYLLKTKFKKSNSLNPLQNLFFCVIANGSYQGIGEFHRLNDNWVEGEGYICFSGKDKINAEVQILYRLSAKGTVWVENISLTETAPLPPRWVKIACTQGPGRLEDYNLETFSKAMDIAGKNNVDIILLPEYINGEGTTETLSGASAKLMSGKSAKYKMYVAGTIGRYDEVSDALYNSVLLFDRGGKLVGLYDKIHLYGPELNRDGVTPGKKVQVFDTDFGKVGFMTCYDSWFTDVAELVALKGADILLFPNLGYDRGILHARALDNFINIVVSSRSGKYGIWDSMGRDILNLSPEEELPSFKDIKKIKEAGLDILIATIDISAFYITEVNGGNKMPKLRSRKHSANQNILLEDEIKAEKNRWWVE